MTHAKKGRLRPMKHDARWDRSAPEIHTRWVHGWHISVYRQTRSGTPATLAFVLTNQPGGHMSYDTTDKITVTRSQFKSFDIAERQAMTIVRALRPLVLGWPE